MFSDNGFPSVTSNRFVARTREADGSSVTEPGAVATDARVSSKGKRDSFLFRLNGSIPSLPLGVLYRYRPLSFRIDVGAPANINARISHLAESETASLKNAHAAAGADRQRAAKELLSCVKT